MRRVFDCPIGNHKIWHSDLNGPMPCFYSDVYGGKITDLRDIVSKQESFRDTCADERIFDINYNEVFPLITEDLCYVFNQVDAYEQTRRMR
jgi:hypothetical protein